MVIAIKKQWLYKERDDKAREIYNKEIDAIPQEKRIYLDECGFDLNMIKEYRYQLKSERLLADRSGTRGKRISVIGARDYKNNLIAPMRFEGYTDKTVFMAYLQQVLLPILKEG